MSWHAVARIGEIVPGSPKIMTVGGKEVGVFFEGGRYFAVLNFCPHLGAPVCRGKIFGAVLADEPGKQTYDPNRLILRCPWHRWEFDLETGKALAPIRQRLRTYPVEVRGGDACEDAAAEDAVGDDATEENNAVTTYAVRVEESVIWVQV